MSIAEVSVPSSVSFGDGLWRISVDLYHDMIRHGILTDDDPVELIDGLLVEKMPRNRPHRLTIRLLHEAISALLPPGWHSQTQDPITLEKSEPEPDLAVVRGKPADYSKGHPGPTDLCLVVEVADSSLSRDRGMKKRMYARAKIAIYWIVNLIDGIVEIYSSPTTRGDKPDYLYRKDVQLNGQLELEIEGRIVSLRVEDFLQKVTAQE